MVRIAMLICSLSIAPALAAGAPPPSRCVDVSTLKEVMAANAVRWIQLTPEQWQFMRGIYAMNPQTPPGLPYGDKAVLAQLDGNNGGMIFFIDGGRACTPMPVPAELVTMMRDVATGEVPHEPATGSGL
jgi:hypothetical protein